MMDESEEAVCTARIDTEEDARHQCLGDNEQKQALEGFEEENDYSPTLKQFSRENIKLTAFYYSSFAALGIAYASFGPSIPMLKRLLGISDSYVSWMFLSRGLGSIIGSFLNGYLLDRFIRQGKANKKDHRWMVHTHRVLSCATAAFPMILLGVALISNYYAVVFLFVLFGIASNLVDVFINTLMVGMLGEDGAPLMQALHFFFGVGTMIAPLLFYVVKRGASILLSHNLLKMSNNGDEDGVNEGNDVSPLLIRWELVVSTLLCVLLIFPSALSYVLGLRSKEWATLNAYYQHSISRLESSDEMRTNRHETIAADEYNGNTLTSVQMETKDGDFSSQSDDSESAYEMTEMAPSSQCKAKDHGCPIHSVEVDQVEATATSSVGVSSSALLSSATVTVLFMFTYLAVYVGLEVGFGNWINTFALATGIVTDDAQADLLAALFWGSFTVMRGMGVFIAMRLSPLQMIAGDQAVGSVALCMLTLSVALEANISGLERVPRSPVFVKILLWGGCALLGGAMASVYASVISLPSSISISMSARSYSLAVIGAVVGFVMEKSVLAFSATCMTAMGVLIVTFVSFITWLYCLKRPCRTA